MKKTIILTLLGALTLGAPAADYQYLVFTTTDGTQAVAASDLTLTISDGNLVASSGTTTLATIPLASLTAMEFSNDGTTGIEALEGISRGTCSLSNATEVYDLNGRRMASADSLPAGVYIMKIDGRTLKVAVK